MADLTAPRGGNVRSAEVAVVATLTVMAFVLRAWAIGRVGLGQYDEGVYALSALGVTDPAQPHRVWPSEIRFAPPVYFLLVALSYLVQGGPSDSASVFVNVVLGSLLVPAAWWAGRSWFGPGAGVVAATLTALSEYQIIMSRSGLTDTAFTLFFTVAVVVLVSAMEEGGTGRAILAGVATGLAWNTKYHGWFVLLVGAGAWVAWSWWGTARPVDRRRAAGAWVTASLVAGLTYLPWALYIQANAGGTAEWSRYYAGMLSRDWLGHFVRHASLQWSLEGPWTRASLPLALSALIGMVGGYGRRSRTAQLLALGALAMVAFVAGGAAVTVALALAAALALLADPGGRARLATWAALTWSALWVVAAPVYRPYFRLLLPFTVVTAVLGGVVLDRWLTGGTRRPSPGGWSVATVGFVLAVVVFLTGGRPGPADPWRNSSDMRAAAAAMTRLIPDGAEVRVIWEPPVAYYLQVAGRRAFEDVEDITVLDTMTVERYIVTGIYVRRTPRLREGIERHRTELEELGRFPVQPTDIRILDDMSPERAREYRSRPDSTFDLVLYRYRPRGVR